MDEILQTFSNWLKLNNIRNNIYVYATKQCLKKVGYPLLSQELLDNYLLERKQNVAKETFNIIIKSLKKFFIFDKIDFKLPAIVKVEKGKPVEHFSLKYFEDNIVPMVEYISKNITRDIALLYFMFYTALRKSEYVLLKRENINLNERIVRIFEPKTQQYRIVKFPKKVKELLKIYFSMEQERTNAFNCSGEIIYNLCRKLNKHCKDVHIHPHTFRHSACIHFLKQGIPVIAVSKLLGHSNILTTMRYLQLTDTEIMDMYDQKIK